MFPASAQGTGQSGYGNSIRAAQEAVAGICTVEAWREDQQEPVPEGPLTIAPPGLDCRSSYPTDPATDKFSHRLILPRRWRGGRDAPTTAAGTAALRGSYTPIRPACFLISERIASATSKARRPSSSDTTGRERSRTAWRKALISASSGSSAVIAGFDT